MVSGPTETGSYLHLHVDTAQTHVVSGIMNVAQDLEGGDDWPVEILDHGGKLPVNMKPGVCCTSPRAAARAAVALQGRSYANIGRPLPAAGRRRWTSEFRIADIACHRRQGRCEKKVRRLVVASVSFPGRGDGVLKPRRRRAPERSSELDAATVKQGHK